VRVGGAHGTEGGCRLRDRKESENKITNGGSLNGFASADHLAGFAPTPRDSGRRVGNLHRPKRYNRQLQRVFYASAVISIQRSPASRAFYDRERADGKRHSQAVLALARRRVNVLWAMLRDGRPHRGAGARRGWSCPSGIGKQTIRETA